MAFTEQDRDALRKARIAVAELEIKKQQAGRELLDTLDTLGLRLAFWAKLRHVLENADAIRDALAPFDSGYRAAQDDS